MENKNLRPGSQSSISCLLRGKYFVKCLLLLLASTHCYGFDNPERCLNQPSLQNRQFIGAELYANTIEPGKLSITLQVFYSTSSITVAETETVTVIEKENQNPVRTIELKKQKEFIDVKYALVEANNSKILPSVKSVLYSGVAEPGVNAKSCDISWVSGITTELFNNVAANSSHETIVLMVHIADVTTASYNNVPCLNRLPVLSVSSAGKTSGSFDVIDSDITDIIEVTLGAPLIIDLSKKNNALAKSDTNSKTTFQKPDYRNGFSAEMPAAKSFLYKKEAREFDLENLSPGNYLFALIITDYRNQIPISQHQAVFIIESIL